MLTYIVDQESVKSYSVERDKLNTLLMQEEIYRKQRAKIFWLTKGDPNSKFFHAYASAREQSNFVDHLRSEEGEIVSSEDGMHTIVVNYFNQVFAETGQVYQEDDDRDTGLISVEQNQALLADLKYDEFTRTVK